MANDHFAELVRLEASETLGRPIFDFFEDSVDRQNFCDLLEREGVSGTYQLRTKRDDGAPRCVLACGQAMEVDGEPVHLCVFYDISDRLRVEEDLRRTRAEVQQMARVGDWRWDIATDRVSWSPELFNILGYHSESDDPSRQAFIERIHPDDRALVEERIATLVSERVPFSIDHRIVLSDGSVKFLHSIARVECGTDGAPRRLFGIAQDITERREYQEELELKDRAIESSISGIGITDLEGVLVYVNDSLVRMWGFDHRDEILGRYLPEFWEGDRVAQTVRELLTEGCSEGEDTGKRKDGSLFPVEYSACILEDGQGNPLYMYGSFVDISDRKKASEALLELSGRLINAQEQERSRIARELHDDLSQHLALLAMELETLGQNPPRSELRLAKKTAELSAQVKQLSSSIHQMSYQLHPSSLERLGLEVAIRRLCREMSEQKGIRLNFESRDIPDSIPDDTVLCLYRVAQEALRNVVTHSQAESADVVLSAGPEGLRIVVSDNGIGYDLSQSTEQTGLGVISMRERLRAIGGRLSIESAPGEGARVEAVVPLQQALPSREV